MATTRTPGITLARDGRFFIDKRYRGIRIGMRIGAIDQEQAEQRLRTEMAQVDLELARQASRPLFADCVLAECRRPPYPITWEEQDRLFPMLPAHLARMALFAVNTGLRDSNVCGAGKSLCRRSGAASS